MRAFIPISALFLVGSSTLFSQPGARQVDTITVLNATVEIPAGDLRRVSLPPVRAGDSVLVEFRTEQPGIQVALEILRRDHAGDGNTVYHHMRHIPGASSGEIGYLVPAAGSYVLALRQSKESGESARIHLHVQVRHARTGLRSQARMLSREKRIAVAVFSLGFLWTTLVLCGAPLIRAFRSRRKPSSPPWFG